MTLQFSQLTRQFTPGCRRRLRWIVAGLLLVALVSGGCRKSETEAVVGEPTPTQEAMPVETAVPPVVADEDEEEPVKPVEESADRLPGAGVAPSAVSGAGAESAVRGRRPTRSADKPPVMALGARGANEPLLPLSRTVNVLVLGSDRRPRMPNWRTDVIMIIALNLDDGVAGVISIPRDVYIDHIPNHQPNRINAIDYLGERDEPDGGGPKLLAAIIEEKMGVPIHHYLRFDFDGFKEVIDALNGVAITLDCPVSDYLPEEDIAIRLPAGEHRLTGKQALAYVRSRRQGGDLERARRQQRITWAVRDQIRNENLLPRVPALYAALRGSVQTDIGLVTAIRFVRFALALEEDDVHGMVVAPPDLIKEGWRGGMFVFVADWPLIAEQVQHIFDRPPLVETSTTVDPASGAPKCP